MTNILESGLNVNFFQEFDDYRDADDAVYELNGKELLGERYVWLLLVTYAQRVCI